MIDVELINVTKEFGDKLAVKNISLQVKSGEFLSLLGPSGCGKTTTLKLIGGLEEPSQGTIKIKGKVVNAVPANERDTATVFQNWALFPHKNVFNNIAFGLRMRGVSKNKIKKKVKEYLKLVRLPGYEKKMPGQMSGGEQQRVALARALIIEPSVLLLDEPLSNLDLALRQQMRVELKQIQKKVGVTTIFVTHDQTEALTMSDRIAVMDIGKIAQVGSPVEVYERPRTAFVADFIGQTNFFVGEVSSIEESKAVIVLDSDLSLIAKNIVDLKEKDRVSVYVRVEDILILGEDEHLENTFQGGVYHKAYMGRRIQYFIRLNDKTSVSLNQKITSSSPIYEIGDKIRVGWKSEDCLCFPVS